MYKIAIFDMDGTILNTLGDLMDSTNFVLQKNGYPEHTLNEIRTYVGNGAVKLFERAVPAGTDAFVVQNLVEQFKPYYEKHCALKTCEYPGITDLLKKLHEAGVLCAVCSNKPEGAVRELCELYFSGLFDHAIGGSDGVPLKPAPDGVNNLLAKLGLQKSDAVFIGDSDVDVQTGLNAKVSTIGVSWGFKGHEFLEQHGAPAIADDAQQLADLLLQK